MYHSNIQSVEVPLNWDDSDEETPVPTPVVKILTIKQREDTKKWDKIRNYKPAPDMFEKAEQGAVEEELKNEALKEEVRKKAASNRVPKKSIPTKKAQKPQAHFSSGKYDEGGKYDALDIEFM